MADARQLMQGAIDTHVHSAPDLVERKLDDIGVAREARERGMAAIVLKNHFSETAMRARIAEEQVPGVRVIGSVVLNNTVGGMNPWAVEAAARAGARVVWMPTFQAEHQIQYQARQGGIPHRARLEVPGREPAVRVFGADGNLTADAENVLEIVRDRRMVLASGHHSPAEVERLSDAAQKIGLKKLLLTHPELPVINMPVELQRRLVEKGAYCERVLNVTVPPYSAMTMAEVAARIREVGPESTVLATDFGQTYNPTPAEGFQVYLEGLMENGFGEAEIRRMAAENARDLLEI